jgi:uncharacterized protein (DUF2384 family)
MLSDSERALIWNELREFYSPSEAHKWLTTRHPLLKDRRPLDCDFDKVARPRAA